MHIEQKSSGWTFEGISENFVAHAKRSIPGYDEGHDIICRYSDFFCARPTTFVDIGSSTGLLLEKLAKRHKDKVNLEFVGIEPVEDMHSLAQQTCIDKRITFINEKVEDVELPKSNLISSYYTMQFVSPAIRQALINQIYATLEWGGAFLFFEKVRAADARFQDYATQVYAEFKLENNFDEREIVNKSRSLKGVMEPFSSEGNRGLLHRAGFTDITTIYKWVCFEGVLAIK